MICIEIPHPGDPEVLVPAERPTPDPGRGRSPDQGGRRRRQSPGHHAAPRRYPPPPGASDIPAWRWRASSNRLAARSRNGVLAIGSARCSAGAMYAVRVAPAPQCLPNSARPHGLVGAAALPETFFTVWTNVVRPRTFASGEIGADATAVRAGSARTAIQLARARSGARLRDGRDRERSARRLRTAGRRAMHQLPRGGLRRGGARADRRRRRRRRFWTWSAPEYFPAISSRLPLRGASSKSPRCAGPKTELNIQALMQRRLTVTGSTLRTAIGRAERARLRLRFASTSGRCSKPGPSRRSSMRHSRCGRRCRRIASWSLVTNVGKLVLVV